MPTSIFLLGFLFICIQYFSPLLFFVVLQVFILAALVEFYNLADKRDLFPHKILGVLLSLIIGASFYFESFTLEMAVFTAVFLAAWYFVLYVNRLEKLPRFPSSVALTFFGPLYISFTLNFFYVLRGEKGPFVIYYLFAVIFLGDTGAYFIGKLLGRHRLVPVASPKKTWEGAFGGIVFACLGGVLAQQVLLPDMLLWKAVLFSFLIHAAAQASDPFESLFKRAAGVKDSSHLLPGHGGFFDRIDSLILATPLLYFLIRFIGLD